MEKNERERNTRVSFSITLLNYQAWIRFLIIFYFLKSMDNENSLVFLVIGLWIFFVLSRRIWKFVLCEDES